MTKINTTNGVLWIINNQRVYHHKNKKDYADMNINT